MLEGPTRYWRVLLVAFGVAVLTMTAVAARTSGGDAEAESAVLETTGDPTDAETPPAKALATLSDGHARREAAAVASAAPSTSSTAPEASAGEVAAGAEVTAMVTTTPPTTVPPTTAPPTTAPAPPVPSARSGVWDQLAACESGGRWDLNTGNGYSGGLQMAHSTWVQFGGTRYAPYAHLAGRDQQIAVAEAIVAASGGSYSAWGGCAAALGLP